jgi:hypothetical protein
VGNDYTRPKMSSGDVVHTGVKTVLSAIPFIGGSAAELFSSIITPPLTNRRDEWVSSIAIGLKELEDKVGGFCIEDLSHNEVFVTTLLHASQTAIRNHQVEKLVALKNAVLNTALSPSVDENTIMIFLSLVDTFTPWHLKVLLLFQNPNEWARLNGLNFENAGAPIHILQQAFNELRGRRELSDKLVKDLYANGLMTTDSLHTMMSSSGVVASRTTNLGNQFLDFIKEPEF